MDDFSVLRIFQVVRVHRNNYAFRHVNRPNHGIVYMQNCSLLYYFDDGRVLRADSGDVLYLSKHSSYRIELLREGECIAINFDTDAEKIRPDFVCPAVMCGDINRHFAAALRAWEGKRTGYMLCCKSAVYAIWYALLRSTDRRYLKSDKRNLILDSADYIGEHFRETNLRIGELAMQCGISETYYRRLFSAVFGMSPLHYINRLRIESAKDLLASGEALPTEVYSRCGFHDDGYFFRVFREYTGTTPRQYKASFSSDES